MVTVTIGTWDEGRSFSDFFTAKGREGTRISDRPNWGGEGVLSGTEWIESEISLKSERSCALASISGKKSEGSVRVPIGIA